VGSAVLGITRSDNPGCWSCSPNPDSWQLSKFGGLHSNLMIIGWHWVLGQVYKLDWAEVAVDVLILFAISAPLK